MKNNEEVILTISHENMEVKYEYYGLNEKIKNARNNGFTFSEIRNLEIKIYSDLSRMNIYYYLKIQIPIMHRQFFRVLSQNPEYIRNFCNDRNNSFHFSIRKWYLDNQSP